MRTAVGLLLAAATASTLLTGCFKAPPPWRPSEKQRLIDGMVQVHRRILHDLPNPEPDSADEPKGIDLSGADITFTYWAPLFVISIDTHRRPFIAVISDLHFPPRSTRVTDRHVLPVETAWTDSDHCPALAGAVRTLNDLRGSTALQSAENEYDGGGYLVRMRGGAAVGGLGSVTLSGRDVSPIGRWAAQTRDALSSCWTPPKQTALRAL